LKQEYAVGTEPHFREDLSPRSKGIAIVRSRYQEATSEDTADWKRLSVCDSDL
jgi:hypothetical protein